MTRTGHDSLNTRQTLTVEGKEYDYFSLDAAAKEIGDVSRLPYTLKVLLENLLRFEDGQSVTVADVKALQEWLARKKSSHEIAYRPARVLMQDFTGVPAVVDLAAMREAMVALGGDAQKINPLVPVDLVIDHSVMVDEFGSPKAFKANVKREFERNGERYEFLKWGQGAFDNFRVVPPGTGICHQVNVEYLAQTVWMDKDDSDPARTVIYPDTLVGTDSHTTMVNGLAVLGWGVGGIEAEAAMLGQPVSMLIPEVVGFKLTGEMKEGTTATDLVLRVVEMLRGLGVVGKFVEFYGPGLDNLTLADQATIANMAPEYGATCGFFPIDQETLDYLAFTGRDPHRVKVVEAYAKAQGMWRDANTPDPEFTTTMELDMGEIVPAISGPKRPQDRILLSDAVSAFAELEPETTSLPVEGTDYTLDNGDVVIAAITSCTNTSNPAVMVGAGLLARKAHALGLTVKPWVKTSLAPGSQVVTEYLEKAGLDKDLDALGFHTVGYGCTTCIGNSGPLAEPIAAAVEQGDMNVTAVLSGNRNFEGRISPHVKSNYLASPPLVVAYALAGTMRVDLYNDPLGQDKDGNDVYMKDIWPTNKEIADTVAQCLTPEMFTERYSDVFKGPKEWQAIGGAQASETYDWQESSTYVRNPPFFTGMAAEPADTQDIKGAHLLVMLGDSVTTDHISPAGAIKSDAPAGDYLNDHQVRSVDFNSYGSRRGNDQVMTRGTFANIRIKNEMIPGTEGGITKHIPSGEQMSIYDASMRYQAEGQPLVVIAGAEYGTGSSRDWAAKGTRLLGVKAVVAESFERIHRSNLIGMGVIPLQFKNGNSRKTLNLRGDETFDIVGIADDLKPQKDIEMTVHYVDGSEQTVTLLCRIDTLDELEYYRNGGILHYVLRGLAAA
ncbi:MAG: aconitate hydratase AcnA [Alphaproteobacteria bacterium]|nr:MAG: aconitate hydratase AcnA [Alphaproteobacteria bacterium]